SFGARAADARPPREASSEGRGEARQFRSHKPKGSFGTRHTNESNFEPRADRRPSPDKRPEPKRAFGARKPRDNDTRKPRDVDVRKSREFGERKPRERSFEPRPHRRPEPPASKPEPAPLPETASAVQTVTVS